MSEKQSTRHLPSLPPAPPELFVPETDADPFRLIYKLLSLFKRK
jgi:hypothetical protein